MARFGGLNPQVARDLKARYFVLAGPIQARLADFRRLGETGDDEALFAELAFCLFTPQSKARSCWAAVERLRERGLLCSGEACDVAGQLEGVRFHNTKARNLTEVRRLFSADGRLRVRETLGRFGSGREAREWLVAEVKGLGYKEATHFLRNIGRGEGMAILDRHILRNLVALGVLDAVPASLSRRRYLEIEDAMVRAADALGIPVQELDLLMWCKETSDLFK